MKINHFKFLIALFVLGQIIISCEKNDNTIKENQIVFDGTVYELNSGSIYDDDIGPDMFEIEGSLYVSDDDNGFPCFDIDAWGSSTNIDGEYTLMWNADDPMTAECAWRLTAPDAQTDGIIYFITNGTISFKKVGSVYEIEVDGYDRDGLKCDLYYKGELTQWD